MAQYCILRFTSKFKANYNEQISLWIKRDQSPIKAITVFEYLQLQNFHCLFNETEAKYTITF